MNALTDMLPYDLKAAQRDASSRYLDEASTANRERTNRCLSEDCDNPCVKTHCEDCLSKRLNEFNQELGRRNRELGLNEPRPEPADDEDAEPEAEETKPAPGRSSPAAACSECGGRIRSSNASGICQRDSCRNAYQRALRLCKRPAAAEPPQRSKAITAAKPEPAGELDLAQLRRRAEAQYQGEIAACKARYAEIVGAIEVVERLTSREEDGPCHERR